MQAKYCFILAAGLGSRMGEIGKVIPKPLFPFFERTLIDLQIQYALDLRPEKIFINTHHLSEQIAKYVQTHYANSNVIVLNEKVLLDVGGGIHNVANTIGYKGELIVLNSDVLYLLSHQDHETFFTRKIKGHAILLGLKVKKGSHYNEINIDERELFTGVTGPNKQREYLTYSGVCRINLAALGPSAGISSFFQTVARPDGLTEIYSPATNSEYWDFGTKELFWKNSLKILLHHSKNENSMMASFLKSKRILLDKNVNQSTYSSENGYFYIDGLRKIIVLSKSIANTERMGIYYQNHFESMSE